MTLQAIVKNNDSKDQSISDWLVGSFWTIRDFDGITIKPRSEDTTWCFYEGNKVKHEGSWDVEWSIISDDRITFIASNIVFELVFVTHNFFIAFQAFNGSSPTTYKFIHAGYLKSGMDQIL